MSRIQKKKSARRRVVVLILVAVVLAAVAVFAAKPAYRVFRNWRVDSMIQEGDKAFERGDFTKARSLAFAALNTRTNDYRTLKLLYRSMVELRDPRAGNLTIHLMRHEDATEDDRLSGFTTVCKELPMSRAIALWASLGKEKAQSPEYLVPFVERLIDQGILPLARKLLNSRSDNYDNIGIRFQAIRLMIKGGGKQGLDRAQFMISEIISSDSENQLEAFRFLSSIKRNDFRSGYFPELKTWIEEQPDALLSDKLLALIQELQRKPQAFDQITAEAIETYAGEEPVAVTSWLLSLGEAEQALKLLSEEASVENHELYRNRVRALLALKRWTDASDWLSTPPEQFPALELLCLRVLSTDNPSRRMSEWKLALKEAGIEQGRNAFLDLHQWMLEAGEIEYAKEAMVEAIKLGRGRLPAWARARGLVRWIRRKSPAESLYQFCDVMARMEPGNSELATEAADIACLMGKTPPSRVIEDLTELEKKIPELGTDARHREVLATAYLLNDQPREAEETLHQIQGTGPAYARIEAIRSISGIQRLADPTTAPPFELDWDRFPAAERQALRTHLARITRRPDAGEPAPLPSPSPLPELLPLPEKKPLPELPPMPDEKPLPKLIPLVKPHPLPELKEPDQD